MDQQQAATPAQETEGFSARALTLPGLVAAAVIAMATAAGLAAGSGANSTVSGFLIFSSQSTMFVSGISDWLPVGFAFAAGMVATVNPCGFVMLPAYLTLYVSDQSITVDGNEPSVSRSLVKGLYVSAAVGLGFVLLFGTAGFTISAGARAVAQVFPWIGFGLGFIMAGLGAYILAGGKLYTGAASQAASHIGDPRDATLRGYFLFGISYAVASLSCTLPIFLGLISSSLATGGLAAATGQFLAYALGMTFVITVLTLAIAVFKGALVSQLRRVMPYVSSISAGILIVVGGYLVFYWLTEGELARHFGF
ncbi:MAG: cytochrome c biogenesis protein CcdA [Dehalococcoidia bacterium]